MATFTSDNIELQTSPEKVFLFLEDLNNLELIMPKQVANWKSNGYECSFFIKNLGDLGLKKGRSNFPDTLIFPSSENSKVKFELVFSLSPSGNNNYSAGFEITSEMNSMVEMMAKRPLTNFVNLLTANLKTNIN
jgi:hypothetical protein